MKTCKKCSESKQKSEFGASSQTKDGMKLYCRSCEAEIARNRRADPDKADRIRRMHRESIAKQRENPEYVLALNAKVREYRADPEIMEKHLQKCREYNARMSNCEEWKEKKKAYKKKKMSDPEYRDKQIEKRRVARLDPDVRKKQNESTKKSYQKKKDKDPDFLSKQNALRREKYASGGPRRETALRCATRWRKENPGHKYHMNRMRILKIKNRIPPWADIEKIKEIYKNCPDGMHVDHIIPICGEIVSGLHVEYNLQYLTAKENLEKNNAFDQELFTIIF